MRAGAGADPQASRRRTEPNHEKASLAVSPPAVPRPPRGGAGPSGRASPAPGTRARAAARRRRPRGRGHAGCPTKVGERNLDPRTHAGRLGLAVARRSGARRAPRPPRPAARPGLHGHGGARARAGHRREHGAVQRRLRPAAPAAAVSRPGGDRARGQGMAGQHGTPDADEPRAACTVGRRRVVRPARRVFAPRHHVDPARRQPLGRGRDPVLLLRAGDQAAPRPALHPGGHGGGRAPGRAPEPRRLDEPVRVGPGRRGRHRRYRPRAAHRRRGAARGLRARPLLGAVPDAARGGALRAFARRSARGPRIHAGSRSSSARRVAGPGAGGGANDHRSRAASPASPTSPWTASRSRSRPAFPWRPAWSSEPRRPSHGRASI